MKLIVIPPYKNPLADMTYVLVELINRMKATCRFKGVEIDLEAGFPLDEKSEARDAEFLAAITPGFLKKVSAYSEMGAHDAIVSTGFLDPGYEAARAISRIPVAGALHSSLLTAALIGKRTSIIIGAMPLAMAVRQVAESYGLGHRLASLRSYGHSTTRLLKLINQHQDQLFASSEADGITKDMVTQCITAIEVDRVDSLILGCEPTEFWQDQIRAKLDAAGYDEIPLISPTAAAVQMAMVMVHTKLAPAPRAYPTDRLRAQPAFA